MQRRTLKLFAGLAVVAVADILLACADERSVNPTPESYLLYVGMNPAPPLFEAHILVIDCDADSVIDSLSTANLDNQWGDFFSLPTPGMIVIPHHGIHEILDTRSKSVVASLLTQFASVVSLPEMGRIVGSLRDSAVVFEDTTFVPRSIIHRELYSCRRLAKSFRIIGRSILNDQGGPLIGSMIIYDLATNELTDSFMIDPLDDGLGFAFIDFEISPDGRRLYAIGEDKSGSWLMGYDIDKRSTLFRYHRVGDNFPVAGDAEVSPDGREVWVTWGANNIWLPWPQAVYVIDGLTGMLLDTIDMSQETLSWPRAVSPQEIRFTPDGNKVCISCGTSFTGTQPLVVVDARSREIIRVLFQSADRIPREIVIGHKP